MNVDLTVDLAKLRLPNPIIVASGPPTMSPDRILKSFKYGAGGVVSKTIGFDPVMQLQPKPRMYVTNSKDALAGKQYSFYSIDLMSEYPPEKWVRFFKKVREDMKQNRLDGILVASIAGRDYEEWERLAKIVEGAGVDAVETNLSCPHVEKGKLMGRATAGDPAVVKNIIKTVRGACAVPVICKITPHGANPVELAKTMVSAGANALVSTARFQGLVMDPDGMRPILWGGYGGYGGPWQVPISLSWTAHIAASGLGVPIIGSGGISSGDDMLKFIMVGADAVQICTAVMILGYEIIPRMKERLEQWMGSKHFARIRKFRGRSLGKIIALEDLPRNKVYRIGVNGEKCTSCGVCVRACPYDAISLDQGKKAIVDDRKCDNCGLCVSICPFDAMKLEKKNSS